MNSSKITATVANNMLATLQANAAGGSIVIRSGTQPANGGDNPTDGAVLATFALPTPAFNAPVGGVMSAAAIDPVTATGTGTATWFRIFKADGVTPLLDGSVGTAGCDLNIANTSITTGDTQTVTSLTITQPLQ